MAQTDYDKVLDSGKREEFATGAVRDTRAGKGRYDLLPAYAIHRVARVFENGAVKYDDENWRNGIHLRRYLDSALRHLFKFLEGNRDEDHAAQAVWNVLAMIETEEMIRRGLLPVELNDLPDYTAPESEVGTDAPVAVAMAESGTVDVPLPKLPFGYLWTGEYRRPRKGEHYQSHADSAIVCRAVRDWDFVAYIVAPDPGTNN